MTQLEMIVEKLKSSGRRSPFLTMANRQLELVRHTLEDMVSGVLDLYGSREDIVTGLTEFVAGLGPDDMYLTISIPQFWWRANVGRDGRFLSMNQLAAVRGATIRRVFLITDADKQNSEYQQIMSAQLRVKEDLDRLGKCVSAPADVEKGGYFVGSIPVTSEQQLREIQAGHQVGLLRQGGVGLLLAAMYRDDGTFGYVQFRSAPALVEGTSLYIEEIIKKAEPLTESVLR